MLVSLFHPPQASQNFFECSHCREAQSTHLLIHCATCSKATCPNCIRGVYPSRDRLGVCKRCPLPHTMMAVAPIPPTFICGRCQVSFSSLQTGAGDAPAFFCAHCGTPICIGCFPRSFECGSLCCKQCCATPLRWSDKGIRQQIDEGLLAELYSGSISSTVSRLPTKAPAAVTKYTQLTGKTFIGKGAQAIVYKCQTKDGEQVVSKEMTFTDDEDFEEQRVQAERMKLLSHTHLIRYLDVISDRVARTIHIILPYYSKGDLKQLIFDHKGAVPVFQLCSLTLQLTTALVYLHNQRPALVHGDVKPENVLLLNNEEQVLLMDLDLCCEEDRPVPGSSIRGTLGGKAERAYTCEYSAPEIRQGWRRTPKADIFSLGVVTYALAALPSEIFLTYKGNALLLSDEAWEKDFHALDRLIRTAIQRRCSSYPRSLVDLIMDMLRYRPEDRPTSSEVESRLSDIMMSLLE